MTGEGGYADIKSAYRISIRRCRYSEVSFLPLVSPSADDSSFLSLASLLAEASSFASEPEASSAFSSSADFLFFRSTNIYNRRLIASKRAKKSTKEDCTCSLMQQTPMYLVSPCDKVSVMKPDFFSTSTTLVSSSPCKHSLVK